MWMRRNMRLVFVHVERCKIGSTPQNEWYFFSHKDRKYPTGSRTNRATSAGFWKATGRDKCIRNSFSKIGMRKTLVFYRGRAPHGQKSDWIMHEYRLEDSDNEPPPNEDGWVICRVFKKKNLFKINNSNSNNGEGGGGVMSNSSCDPIFSQRNNSMNQYLLQHDYSHIPLQYPQVEAAPQNYHLKQLMLTTSGSNYDHHPHPHHLPASTASASASDYDHHHPPPLINNMQVKQFMSSTTRDTDCDSASPAAAAPNNYQSGLDCDDHQSSSQPPNPMLQADDHHWDRLVASNPTSINQINHLSLRSEMDFWAYPTK